jgi:hypothetical protein
LGVETDRVRVDADRLPMVVKSRSTEASNTGTRKVRRKPVEVDVAVGRERPSMLLAGHSCERFLAGAD